jgi:hypothetical protein
MTPTTHLQTLIGRDLDDIAIENADWRDYYPLSLDHRTVNGIIHHDALEPGDVIILDLYVARGDDTPWNLEEVANQIEREWHTAPQHLDYSWYAEAFAELDPGVAIAPYPTITSCLLSYWQLSSFRARVQAIADREGYDRLTVLLVIARALHEAYRRELTNFVSGEADDLRD